MKIFTYLRTLWHEFWMCWWVGPASSGVNIQELKSVENLPELVVPEYLKPQKPLTANISVSTNRELTERMVMACKRVPTLNLGPTVEPIKNKLWVYNVSRVDHKFDHPMLGEVVIPANTTKKRYSLWTSFPSVVMEPYTNLDTNEMYLHRIGGEHFVRDIINPDSVCGKGVHTAVGRDLSVKGVFWSYNNPPLVREVNAAIRLMAERYADLLERVAILWESVQLSGEWIKDYKKLKHCSTEAAIVAYRNAAVGEITPEHHAAAEYFKVTTPWHPVLRG